jgi:hypothetical protein
MGSFAELAASAPKAKQERPPPHKAKAKRTHREQTMTPHDFWDLQHARLPQGVSYGEIGGAGH